MNFHDHIFQVQEGIQLNIWLHVLFIYENFSVTCDFCGQCSLCSFNFCLSRLSWPLRESVKCPLPFSNLFLTNYAKTQCEKGIPIFMSHNWDQPNILRTYKNSTQCAICLPYEDGT